MKIKGGAGHRMTGKHTSQARGVGYEYVHVCVDDAARIAYVEVLADEKAVTAVGSLSKKPPGTRLAALTGNNVPGSYL